MLKKKLRVMQNALDALPRPLAPPWTEFPNYSPTSMGWRMGAGETYLDYFRDWFSTLSEEDRQTYITTVSIPEEWVAWIETIHS
ncbi:hypothetical protein [Aliiroseovarius halocynthiae]|uniref:Uncharacterized protein n=2 Tax=Aliiroseovarius halocynthiae TaxID=985055 RepID=A0A545SM67_9RHOB|nr:hypothetical protein [Aliiroseovarius halocynthiae]TQV65946.1 hypothetical protein FIL88_15785 [Aliiroseovarius halocynthiae]